MFNHVGASTQGSRKMFNPTGIQCGRELVVELEDGTQRLRADDILEVRHRPGAVMTLAGARAHVASFHDLLGERRAEVSLMVVVGSMRGQDCDARRYLANDSGFEHLFRRIALVVRSPVARVVVSVFLALTKARQQFRVFSDEQPATAWLERA